VVVATDTLEPGLTTAGATDRPAPAIRASRIAVGAVSVVPIAAYLWVALHQIGYPYELEWMEGGSAEIVARVVHGQAIYVAPSLHYVPYAYTPLYFWTAALVAHVTGTGFLALRLVSFAASLGSFALLFSMVRRETGDAVAGLFSAGLFAATFEVGGGWLDIGRVDSLFVFFLLAAVAVGRRAAGGWGGVATGALVVAAVLTKQSALLAAAPALAVLVVTRRRAGLAAVATVAAGVVGSTLVLQATTHGWYWWYTVGELVHQGTAAAAGARFVPRDLVTPAAVALALALGGLVVGRWRHVGRTVWGYWLAVAGGFVATSWLSRLHAGGGRDVLIPAYAAVALLAALGYDALRRGIPAPPVLVNAGLAVACVVQVAVLFGHPSHYLPRPGDQAAGRRFVAQVAATRGPVIVYDHPWYDTMAHKASFAQGEAVNDVLRAGPSPARRDLVTSIDQVLGSSPVSTVYVDDPGDAATLGTALTGHFALDRRPVFRCFQCFFPATDVALRPYLRYVRQPAASRG